MRVWMMALFYLFLALPAGAGEKVTIHGFAMDTYLPGHEPSDHVRLIITDKVRSDLLAKVVLTPIGPISNLSYAEIIWSEPLPGIQSLTIGRTFPVFGRIWYDRRVDMVPTIIYSDINLPLAAIDTGATLTGKMKRWQWTTGLYSGDAVFGNNHSANLSLRGEYNASQSIILGMSQRVSAVSATGFDAVWSVGKLRLTGESITSESLTQYALLSEFAITPKTSFALQREWLIGGNVWTGVVTREFGRLGAKFGYQAGSVDRWLGQVALRW